MMRFLITGTAGFIGFHLARRLIAEGHVVTGIDGMTTYYDIGLKKARVSLLQTSNLFQHHEFMLEDALRLNQVVEAAQPEIVIHLAAQAGVRYSLDSPRTYLDSNVVGTFNLMEAVRVLQPRHFLLASTSSVFGGNTVMPFRETDRTDHPLTFYAATKKATEDMAHSYSHLWGIPTTAFRFFTVYGPWGRPDMALFKFVKASLAGEPIDVYGHGQMQRDFTYIDDLVESILRLVEHPPVMNSPIGEHDSLSAVAPYRVVNIAGGTPVKLMDFIDEIERCLGIEVKKNYMDMQKGDVPATFASADLLECLTGYRPSTPVSEGVERFVGWYRQHYLRS
jgi:UDP-glucuronate 4-epimerase